MMKFLAFILVAMMVLPFAHHAESTKATEPPNKRTCRIIFPDRHKDAPKSAFLYDGKENHPVRLPSMNFSKVLELPEGEFVLTLSSVNITDPTSQLSDKPQLKIDESVQDFYILVSSDAKNPESLQLQLIHVSADTLPNGHTRWINQTDHLILGALGESEIVIQPEEAIVVGSPISKSGYYRAAFSFRAHARGETFKITEQHWWHDVDSKHLGFIVNSGGRMPKIFYFRDFRSASPMAAENKP